MNELTKWFDAVTTFVEDTEPAVFDGIDTVKAMEEIERLAEFANASFQSSPPVQTEGK